MAKMPENQNCGNCRFFEEYGEVEDVENYEHEDNCTGSCVRFPPIRIRDGSRVGYWPGVPNDYWCGEWSPANPETVEQVSAQLARHVLLGDMTAAHALVDRLVEIRNG